MLTNMNSLAIVRNAPSNGAKFLGETLHIRRFYPATAYKSSARFLVNWGNSQEITAFKKHRIINPPSAVAKGVDKGIALSIFKAAGVPTLEFSTNGQNIRSAFPKAIIVARTLTRASQGKGIVIIRPDEKIVPAPLYTKYEPKQAEYRVHWGFGFVHIQQKKKKSGVERDKDQELIRSWDNGWVFCENEIDATPQDRGAMINVAEKAVKALGLHFGAVDILHTKDGRFLVCEVNSAPAIETTKTQEHYVKMLSEFSTEY